MLLKLSNLNSYIALTLGYLNPALNNSALMYINIKIEGKNCSSGCPPVVVRKNTALLLISKIHLVVYYQCCLLIG